MNVPDISKIDVLILCGGKGERLKSIVKDRPKPMADIDGRPFLDILIKYLKGHGFRSFILCAGYKGSIIRDYYTDRCRSLKITTLIEGELLGTAGAIKNAESFIKGNPFLVLNGDSFCQLDYLEFLRFHLEKNALYSIALVKMRDNRDGGLVYLDNESRVKKFEEKVKPRNAGYVNVGAYLLDRRIFTIIKPDRKTSLEYDVFPTLIEERFFGYVARIKFIDIGTPDKYYKARRLLSD